MEPWRHVWRNGFAPMLPHIGLQALRAALAADSRELTQGFATEPLDAGDCQAACAIGLAMAAGFGVSTVVDVRDALVYAQRRCNQYLQPGACLVFFAWWDTGERRAVFAALLAEVDVELSRRAGVVQ